MKRDKRAPGICRNPLWLVAALMMILCSVPSAAQLPTGTILGVVRDSSGAVVPAATVTIRNLETDLTRTAATGDDGAYRFPALPTGHYEVKVEHPGFKTETQTGLVLDVSEELVANASLEIGASTQQVVVTGEAPLVDTTTSSLGGLVNEDKMSDLPLNGRNYIDLSLLQPGVTRDYMIGTGGGTTGTAFSSNGAPIRSNNVTIDGASMMNTIGVSVGSESGTTLGVDGIKEYKVITNNFSAEYGMAMGSQVQLVSKGGSNQFHGDGFEYFRNNVLDARNFFDLQPSLLNGERLPAFRRNNFGGSFGGPIKKDKTFFYGVYEGLRQLVGFTVHGDVVPPAACHYENGTTTPLKAGDTILASAGCPLGSYIGSGGKNVTSATIPNSTAGQDALALLNLYPLPNVGTNGFGYQASDLNSVDYGQFRVDENFSSKDTAFARYTIDNSSLTNANTSTAITTGGTAFPQFELGATSINQFLSLSESHIFSPSLLNTARISYSRPHLTVFPIFTNAPGGNGESVLPWGMLTGPQYSFRPGLPVGSVAVTPYTTIGPPGTYGTPQEPVNFITNTYTLSDDVNYTKGKHALKFGVLINRFNFGGDTSQGTSGLGSATFTSLAYLFNATPVSYTAPEPNINPNRYIIFNTVGLYAQDDWRLTSRFTLNLGLRYEFFTQPWDPNNRIYEIQGDADRYINPTATTSTQGSVFVNYSLRNFSPRLGFAWDIRGNGKTSVRGGFGIFYDIANVGALGSLENAIPPLTAALTVSPPATVALPLTVPFNFNTPYGSLGSITTANYNAQSPHTLQYNLTVEQQLPGNVGLSISYVGLRGIHLWATFDGNPVIPTTVGGVSPITNGTVNLGLLYSGGTPYYGFGTPADPRSVACETVAPTCRINPNFQNAALVTTEGDSFYNSVQVNLNRRLSKGLELQGAYTFANSLDDGQGEQQSNDCGGTTNTQSTVDPLSFRQAYGRTCFIVRNNLHVNLLYHFPLLNGSGFKTKLLNGWWMGNIISVQSGYPFSVAMSSTSGGGRSQSAEAQLVSINTPASIAAAGACTSQPGQTAAGSNPCGYTPIPYNASTVITGNPNEWFNPAMFSLAPVGYVGNSPRDLLWGPGLGTWDFSLVKDTAVPFFGEQGSVQFRAEFFNILNRANFGPPSGSAFLGNALDSPSTAPYLEAPLSTTGLITSTITTSRQIQLALKLLF